MDFPNLTKAIEVIAALRHPETGCPWDLEQDHQTLLKYLIEESYEYIHSVHQDKPELMEEELGDVLLQVLLHAQIASESKKFDIDSVAKKLADKMIFRHPHVFKDPNIASNSDEVRKNWEDLKSQTKKQKPYHIMEEDAYLPSLLASSKIGAKSQKVNFDWDNVQDVLEKVEEELEEVKEEMRLANSKEKTKEEIGDLLFSVAQLARHLDIDPEDALFQANLKFIRRINQVVDNVKADGHQMKDLPTEKLEEYWVNVKNHLKLKNS